jgi:hypothetical protein
MMSVAEGANLAPQPTAPLAPPLTAAQVLTVVKDNFVLVSAAAAIVGVVLATTFFAGYLSVFDWHLLWYVQYTDLLTIGIVALGIISGSVVLLQTWTQNLLELVTMDQRKRRWWTVGWSLLIVFILTEHVWNTAHQGEPVLHIFFGIAVLGAAIALIVMIVIHVIGGAWPATRPTFSIVMFSVVLSLMFGQWLGFSLKESAKGQDVTVKGQGVLSNVKVITVLSRHTILMTKDQSILVVPTADISQFKSMGD